MPKFIAEFVFFMLMTTISETITSEKLLSEEERIVGGEDANEGMFPWMVALYKNGEYICSGSIISDQAILTAAHCVQSNYQVGDPLVFDGVVGSVDKDSGDGLRIYFANIRVHPEFEEETLRNDLAILETSKSLPISGTVQPICVSSPSVGKLLYKHVQVMGWGITTRKEDEDLETPNTLQYAQQRITSHLQCSLYYIGIRVPDTVMCVRGVLSGICDGDSGSPLVYTKRGRPLQVGVASFVNDDIGCGTFFGPAAFTRLSYYTDFILENAKGTVCFQK